MDGGIIWKDEEDLVPKFGFWVQFWTHYSWDAYEASQEKAQGDIWTDGFGAQMWNLEWRHKFESYEHIIGSKSWREERLGKEGDLGPCFGDFHV